MRKAKKEEKEKREEGRTKRDGEFGTDMTLQDVPIRPRTAALSLVLARKVFQPLTGDAMSEAPCFFLGRPKRRRWLQ